MQDNQDESSIAVSFFPLCILWYISSYPDPSSLIQESPELPISTLNLPENLKIRLRQQVLELSNALAAISIEKENMQRRFVVLILIFLIENSESLS